jgi:cell division septum initiation protein DivIVA
MDYENIEINQVIDDLKDRLFYLKKETAELNEKIDILKTALKYRNGQITRNEMRNEVKKIVYRNLNH